MHPAPLLILSALGVTGLVLTATSKAGATGNTPGPAPAGRSKQQETDAMPLQTKKDIAKAIQDLTVDPSSIVTADDGTVTSAVVAGPVTQAAVQEGTALAAALLVQGFPIASKTMRDLSNLASKRIPAPAAQNQIPLPAQCFTPDEQTKISQAAALERDPQKLQTIINALNAKTVPPECASQVAAAVDMLTAILHQAVAKAAEDAALKQTQTILNAPDAPPPFMPGIPGAAPRVTIVQPNDGFTRITQRLLGSQARWHELRDANVPHDADGRLRAVASDAKGGISPILQPGQKLFIPASWPAMPSVTIPASLPVPAPAQGGTSPSVAPTAANGLLRQGSSGAAVVAIQTRLGIPADGKFGPQTTAAVVAFQKAHGLSADGVVGPQTLAAMTATMPTAAASPATTTASTPVVAPAQQVPTGTTLRQGSTGSAVAALQARLGIPADGKYGPQTAAAVAAFQKSRGLSADGVAGPLTLGALNTVVSGGRAGRRIAGAAEDLRYDTHESVAPKSDAEIAAESMCSHLLRLQQKRPDTLGAGREDKTKILRFRHKAGMSIAPNVTPEVLIRAAECGVSILPLVMTWPEGAGRDELVKYKSRLLAIAKEAQEGGDIERAEELVESAKRERGQAAGISTETLQENDNASS